MPMLDSWIAERTRNFDSSGIRKVFDLAKRLKDPINLSIGQPDFEVPRPVKDAMIRAVEDGKNGYALTQGIPELRDQLQSQIDLRFGHEDRRVFVCSGTSGGLTLALLATVNPGDEVILFDPYFVGYPALVSLVGSRAIKINTYPDFQIDLNRVEDAITERTKLILVNSPCNPTGTCYGEDEIRGLAELAARRGILLVSDEIYSRFVYDQAHVSPAQYNPETIVIDGFSKSYAMTGWRVAFAHGPSEVINTMIKLQQFTFVCSPHPAQWACVSALETDMSAHIRDYRAKRDFLAQELSADYEFIQPRGAFYLFPRLPWGSGKEFVDQAIHNNLLIIPGNIFSGQDSHFRISFAVDDRTLQRGVEALLKIARR